MIQMLDMLQGIDYMLIVAYLIMALIVSSVLFYSLKKIMSDKDSLRNTLKTLGGFLVLFLICYFVLARGEETPLRDGKMLSAVGSRLISAALFMFYSLILIASGSMLWFGMKNRK
jgi:glucose-6-phosphate-specific signal transduction histidine kinase